jgi:hypothetical protein
MSDIARVSVLWVALLVGCAAARGQDEAVDLNRVSKRLESLETELRARAASEAHLRERVGALENQLAVERSQNAERLRAIEEQSPATTELEDAIRRMDALPRATAPASTLRLGGYFDLEFRSDQATRNPTFDQHRFVLRADAEVTDGISFKSEIEFEGGGADVSYLSSNQVLVEFAELHFELLDELTFKAGILLVPFGRLNLLHDAPLQDLTDRPLVDQFIIPTTWQEAGVGIQGAFDTGPVVLDYDLILCNGLDDDFAAQAGGGFRDARSSFRRDNNDDLMIIGRIGVTPDIQFLDAANIGFSFGYGEYDDFNREEIMLLGLDWTFRKGPFELLGELASFDLERGPGQVAAGVPGGAFGWYVQLNFHFFPESWRGAWKFFTDESTFTLVGRYGTIDTDDSTEAIDRVARGNAYRDDVEHVAVGFNFRPVEKTVFKFEYQFFMEPGGVDDADNDRFVMSIATYF